MMNNNHDNDNNKPTLVDSDKLQKVKSVINATTINDIKNKLIPIIDNEISLNQKNIQTAQADLQSIRSNRSKLLDKLNEEETEINGLAIKLGLPLFCLTILFLFLVPSLINTNSRQPNNQTNSQMYFWK